MRSFLLILFFSIITIQTQGQSLENKQQSNEIEYNQDVVRKIYLDANAAVFLDGKKVSFKKLGKALQKLQKEKGIVHYSRAAKGNNVGEKGYTIMKLISKYKLPVKFYTDNTFTKVAEW